MAEEIENQDFLLPLLHSPPWTLFPVAAVDVANLRMKTEYQQSRRPGTGNFDTSHRRVQFPAPVKKETPNLHLRSSFRHCGLNLPPRLLRAPHPPVKNLPNPKKRETGSFDIRRRGVQEASNVPLRPAFRRIRLNLPPRLLRSPPPPIQNFSIPKREFVETGFSVPGTGYFDISRQVFQFPAPVKQKTPNVPLRPAFRRRRLNLPPRLLHEPQPPIKILPISKRETVGISFFVPRTGSVQSSKINTESDQRRPNTEITLPDEWPY